MAIYHLHAQMIKRSDKRSAVAAAAYRSASRIVDKRLDQTFDYRKKTGVAHTEILLPVGAGAWAGTRKDLWNAAESAEKRSNSQVAREIDMALPVELTSDEKIELARDYAKQVFVADGMVADLCFHDLNSENPHVHIMLPTRVAGADGFEKKNRDWNSVDKLKFWRESWSDFCNAKLKVCGHDARIDHRSYEDQGIDKLPTKHVGAKALAIAKKHPNFVPENVKYNQQVAEINQRAAVAAAEFEEAQHAVDIERNRQQAFAGRTRNIQSGFEPKRGVSTRSDRRATQILHREVSELEQSASSAVSAARRYAERGNRRRGREILIVGISRVSSSLDFANERLERQSRQVAILYRQPHALIMRVAGSASHEGLRRSSRGVLVAMKRANGDYKDHYFSDYAGTVIKRFEWVKNKNGQLGMRLHMAGSQGLTDAGERIIANTGSSDEIGLMLELAKAKGWESIEFEGSSEFQLEATRRAVKSGMFSTINGDSVEALKEALSALDRADPASVSVDHSPKLGL